MDTINPASLGVTKTLRRLSDQFVSVCSCSWQVKCDVNVIVESYVCLAYGCRVILEASPTMVVLLVSVPTQCSSDELQRITDEIEHRLSGDGEVIAVRDELNKHTGYWFIENASDPQARATELSSQTWTVKQSKKPFK